MTLLIGGFSAEQYKSYLNPSKKVQEKWKSSHWVSHFNLARFPLLAIAINRLAYFLLHRMVYPNNTYLIKKFKAHDFTTLKNKDEVKVAKEIFEIFRCCREVKCEELSDVENQLKVVDQNFSTENEAKDLDEEATVKDEEPKKEGNPKEAVRPVSTKESGKDDVKINDNPLALETDVKPIPAPPESKTPAPVVVPTTVKLSNPPSTEPKKTEPKKEEPKVLDDTPSAKEQLEEILTGKDKASDSEEKEPAHDVAAPSTEGEARRMRRRRKIDASSAKKSTAHHLDLTKEIELKKASLDEKEDESVDEESSKPGSDTPRDAPEEKQGTRSMTDSTFKRLRSVFDRISMASPSAAADLEKDEPSEDKENSPSAKNAANGAKVPLPAEIAKIVGTPLAADEAQTLDDFYVDVLFCKNLKTLLAFVKQLEESNQQTDESFYQYMREIDQAFQEAITVANDEIERLHREFITKFAKNPPEALPSNEVRCSREQLEWLSKTLSTEFPAIYHLAFDLPFLKIAQNAQLAALARNILLGNQKGDLDHACFIQLKDTLDKSTTPHINGSESNLLTKAGSYILTLFVGPLRQFEMNAAEVKEELQKIAGVYVQDWLCGKGLSLVFGNATFDNEKRAAEWTSFVRNTYATTLMGMTKEQLRKEVLNPAFNCPFIQLITKAYQDEIDSKEWNDSQFPGSLLEKIFSEELRKSVGQPHHATIKQIIQESCFTDTATIDSLAKKACCAPNLIEPLVRMRIFYILCCIGKKDPEPVVRGLKQRTDTMYDPASAVRPNEAQLLCIPSAERIFGFDDRLFDRKEILVESTFMAPESSHPIAIGDTVLSVSSLNLQHGDNVETGVVDLQKLRFSVHATESYRTHLAAQVDPESLIENMRLLEKKLEGLPIVANVRKFRNAEAAHKASQWSLWSYKFDTKPYEKIVEDSEALNLVLSFAKRYAFYLTSCNKRLCADQLSEVKKTNFNSSRDTMHNQFDGILRYIGELYPNNSEIMQAVLAVRQLIDLKGHLVKESDSDDSPRNDKLGKSSEIIVEPDLGVDTELEIGRRPPTYMESLSSTVKSVLEQYRVEYSSWKIDRYEALIRAAQKCVKDYVKNNHPDGIEQLILSVKEKDAKEWLRQLAPILEFCNFTFRENKQNWDAKYLDDLRQTYNDIFLGNLRAASNWAKDHPNMPGVEHVNGICYHLYTSVNLNQACQKVFDTFIALGKQMQKVPESAVPVDASIGGHHALIKDLRSAHQLIRSVPNVAKAPWIKQVANSVRGHFNGILGLSTFDPNGQSNPMHVFYTKVITQSGQGAVAIRDVKSIAMGSPTIEPGNGTASINPEFRAFLRHCSKAGLKHLYINNQDLRVKSMVEGDESVRCKALHDLAENDFKDTLHIISLNQNSPFYLQQGHEITRRVLSSKGFMIEEETDAKAVKDAVISQLVDGSCQAMRNYLPSHLISDPKLHEWMADEIDRIHRDKFNNTVDFVNVDKRNEFVELFHRNLRVHVDGLLAALPGKWGYSIYDPSASNFTGELIAQMFDKPSQETGNCIPSDLKTTYDLRKWSESMAADIHQQLFAGRPTLEVEERRIFIRLFYRNLARKILIETKVDSYNESCKDSIDRGAASEAEEYAYLAILKNCAKQPHVVAFFKMLVFARAIIVRKRPIIETRLDRLIETVTFMIDHQVALKKLQKKLFPGIDITIDQFANGEEEIAI